MIRFHLGLQSLRGAVVASHRKSCASWRMLHFSCGVNSIHDIGWSSYWQGVGVVVGVWSIWNSNNIENATRIAYAIPKQCFHIWCGGRYGRSCFAGAAGERRAPNRLCLRARAGLKMHCGRYANQTFLDVWTQNSKTMKFYDSEFA